MNFCIVDDKRLIKVREKFIKENQNTVLELSKKNDFKSALKVVKFIIFFISPFLLVNTIKLAFFCKLVILYFTDSLCLVFGLILLHAISHNMFKNPEANKFVGTILGALFFINFKTFKKEHAFHHKQIDSLSNEAFYNWRNHSKFKMLFSNLFMTYIFNSFNKHHKKNKNKKQFYKIIILHVAIILIFLKISNNIFLSIIHIYAFLSLGKFLREFRGACEHARLGKDKFSSTFQANFFDKLLFNSHGMNYHLEHHIFPNIPDHNLKEISFKLREDKYLGHSNVFKSIFHFIKFIKKNK